MQNSLSLHEISPHLAAISSSCITMPGHNQGDEVQPSPLCMCIRSSVALHSDVEHVPLCMFLMRDEKEERKKQARSNKQTRQSNTAHPRQSLFLEKMSCMYIKFTCVSGLVLPCIAMRGICEPE